MPINSFLSKENIAKHKEYLKKLKLLYSVFEKSYPKLSGLSIPAINRLSIASAVKKEAMERKCEIILHELFFSSFCENRVRCKPICNFFGSEANFLYEIERASGAASDSGFIVVYLTGSGEVAFYCGRRFTNLFVKAKPVLAIDLYEHAYFTDYGFDRERYLKNALARLDLSKICEFDKTD